MLFKIPAGLLKIISSTPSCLVCFFFRNSQMCCQLSVSDVCNDGSHTCLCVVFNLFRVDALMPKLCIPSFVLSELIDTISVCSRKPSKTEKRQLNHLFPSPSLLAEACSSPPQLQYISSTKMWNVNERPSRQVLITPTVTASVYWT